MFGRNRGFGKNQGQGQGRRQRRRLRLRDGSCQSQENQGFRNEGGKRMKNLQSSTIENTQNRGQNR